MKWDYTKPTKSGKYVVQTKSDVLKTIGTLQAYYNATSDSWAFKGQKFYRFLTT